MPFLYCVLLPIQNLYDIKHIFIWFCNPHLTTCYPGTKSSKIMLTSRKCIHIEILFLLRLLNSTHGNANKIFLVSLIILISLCPLILGIFHLNKKQSLNIQIVLNGSVHERWLCVFVCLSVSVHVYFTSKVNYFLYVYGYEMSFQGKYIPNKASVVTCFCCHYNELHHVYLHIQLIVTILHAIFFGFLKNFWDA